MKIYIVEYSDWDEHWNDKSFLDEDKANLYCEEINKTARRPLYSVEEYEVEE